jgi:hypothetical protein
MKEILAEKIYRTPDSIQSFRATTQFDKVQLWIYKHALPPNRADIFRYDLLKDGNVALVPIPGMLGKSGFHITSFSFICSQPHQD